MKFFDWFLSFFSQSPKAKQNIVNLVPIDQQTADWQALFGKYNVLDKRFNPVNFPLEPKESNVKVEEAGFEEWLMGTEILHRLGVSGRGMLRLRACGEYLQSHPIRPGYPVIAVGVQWKDPKSGIINVPVFQNFEDKIVVSLHMLNHKYIPTSRWLVKPAAGK